MGKIGEYDDGEIKIEIGESGVESRVWYKDKPLEKISKIEIIMDANADFISVKLHHIGIKKTKGE